MAIGKEHMTDRELLQQALDALNKFDSGKRNHGMLWQVPVIEAIKARLAQPEPAECDGGQCGIGGYCKQCPKTQPEPEFLAKMKGMLEVQGREGKWNYDPYSHGMYNGMEFMVALVEGRNPVFLKAPEKWLSATPQREWVGLTDGEIKNSMQGHNTQVDFARAIEAKLREKNAMD